jgi:beta-lactamase class A
MIRSYYFLFLTVYFQRFTFKQFIPFVMKYILSFLFICSMAPDLNAQNKAAQLMDSIKAELGRQKGVFAMAFRNVQTGETLLLNEHETFHAASTMKTPVMIELYKQAANGKFSLSDSISVKNEFKSIVDGSTYSLHAEDDSQQELYKQIGTRRTVYDLMYQMIIMSSNLATNMLIEMVDGKKVTQTMRGLGAADIQVLRGVEDSKAYAQGLNNTTTAYDLMLIYDKMAKGEIVSPTACADMIKILLNQKFREIIPARLPADVQVAHKTGSINGVQHDSGIVFLPDGKKYVLVLLSRKLEDEKAAVAAMARVSEMLYRYFAGR